MPVPYNKKNMEGGQKGFQSSGYGPTNEEMVDAIKKRKKELSDWWNKPKESPTPKPE